MNDITIRHCDEKDGYYVHGWYVGECPKCLYNQIDQLKADKDKCIAELEAQVDDLEKQLLQKQLNEKGGKERMNDRG